MVRLYMDEHVHSAITDGLRARQVDVLTVQEDGHAERPYDEIIDRATAIGRVLFSYDQDMLSESACRQSPGQPFSGVIHISLNKCSIRRCIDDLEMIAKLSHPEELSSRVTHLPL